MGGRSHWVLHQTKSAGKRAYLAKSFEGTFYWRDHFWSVARVSVATGMLRHPWPSTRKSQPHPTLKGQRQKVVLLDLVRAELIAERLYNYSSRRAQSLPETQKNSQGAQGINADLSLFLLSDLLLMPPIGQIHLETRDKGTWVMPSNQLGGQLLNPQSRVGKIWEWI